jgi:PAS domain S-box-containing protein
MVRDTPQGVLEADGNEEKVVPSQSSEPGASANSKEEDRNESVNKLENKRTPLENHVQQTTYDMLVSLSKDHEDFFRNILENLPLVIYSARSDDIGTPTFVGNQIVDLTGYPSQSFMEEPDLWMRIIHEEDRPMVLAEIDKMRKHGKSINLEYRIITRSGDLKHVRDRSMAMLDDDGNLMRFDGYLEDITTEVEQRREIEKSEMLYRMLIEDIQDGVWAFDENIKVTFANNNLLEMLGYRMDEIIGKPGFMFADPYMISEAEEHIRRRRNGVQESFKFEFRRKDGSKFPALVSASPIIGNDESFKGSILFIRDLTTEIETQEVLEQTSKRFELVQKAARIGSWDWNMINNELIWSDLVEPIFGFKHGAFPGTFQAFLERVHPEDRDRLLAAIDECVHYGKEYILEHRVLLEDGTVRHVLEVGNVLRDWRGNPYRMVGIVKDISEKKQAEFEIRQLNKVLRRQTKDLQAINKELEAFSFSVSHDLKSPLRHIDGFSSLLEGYSEVLDEKGKDYLSRIRSNVKRMEGLIDSLLKLSRISSQPLSWEKIDLTELARDMVMKLISMIPFRLFPTILDLPTPFHDTISPSEVVMIPLHLPLALPLAWMHMIPDARFVPLGHLPAPLISDVNESFITVSNQSTDSTKLMVNLPFSSNAFSLMFMRIPQSFWASTIISTIYSYD